MLTIEEIKQRKSAGKRKWRKSLLPFIKPLFDENIAMDTIVKFLLETYDFVISEDGLYQIKFRYYNAEKSAKKMLDSKIIVRIFNPVLNKIKTLRPQKSYFLK